MSVLNTEQISNPDIRLHQTKCTLIVQAYGGMLYAKWSQAPGIWPEWALRLRYGSPNESYSDTERMNRFQGHAHSIEYDIVGKMRNARIDHLNEDIKHFINSLFTDIIIRERKLATGNGYYVRDARTGGLIMSVMVVNWGHYSAE